MRSIWQCGMQELFSKKSIFFEIMGELLLKDMSQQHPIAWRIMLKAYAY